MCVVYASAHPPVSASTTDRKICSNATAFVGTTTTAGVVDAGGGLVKVRKSQIQAPEIRSRHALIALVELLGPTYNVRDSRRSRKLQPGL